MKARLDIYLKDRLGIASRERAQALILSGGVLVNDTPVTKAGYSVRDDDQIRIRVSDHPYVSRGGVKLAGALEAFSVLIAGRIGMDVGSSTGGFCDVLLERGVQKVYAVDVGKNLLDWKIRSDKRVVIREGLHARDLKWEDIGEKVDVITMDLSFISLTKVIDGVLQFAKPETDCITLIKPQFELDPTCIEKGGIVKNPHYWEIAIRRVSEAFENRGYQRLALIESAIKGKDGNTEFLAHWKLQVSPQHSLHNFS